MSSRLLQIQLKGTTVGEYLGTNTIRQLGMLLRVGEITVQDLISESLSSIRQGEDLKAFINVFDQEATNAAVAYQSLLVNGYDLGPLHGMPIAIKDNIDYAYGSTTYGSSIFRDHKAAEDATVLKRLKAAGAIIVGKTNLHEFAWGGTTSNPHYGVARNPWDKERIPAGSSGGSGIAVAKRMVCSALGTDTGGSIRLPSAMDGVCGIRPTLGDTSIDGIFPVAWSMDTVGPLCSNAEDVELMFSIMSGRSETLTPTAPADLSRLRIGIIEDYSLEGLQPDVRNAFKTMLGLCESKGATIVPVRLQGLDEVVDAQLVVDAVEPSAVHYRLIKERADDYGKDVLSRLLAGCAITGVEYVQAQRFREHFRKLVAEMFKTVDVVLTPTLPFTAPRIGSTAVEIENGKSVSALSGNMRYTAIPSMSGIPAMSVPIGRDAEGLPIGMQIMAPTHREDLAFSFAKAYQGITEFHLERP